MTPAEIKEIDCRIQRAGAANCWTGTLGSLAADARRLVKHIHEGRAMENIPVDHILQGEAELKEGTDTGGYTRIRVPCETCKGIVGLKPTCPCCDGEGAKWKVSSPCEPHKFRDEKWPNNWEEHAAKCLATQMAAAAHMSDLSRKRYTGDEAEFIEEAPRPVPTLRPLPPVEAVDEVESRKAAAFTTDGFYRDNIDELWSKLACLPEGWKITTRAAIHPTSRKYIDLLDKLRDLHLSKSADYGTSDDPLANIRNGAAFVGIEPWRACLVRLSDKVTRIGTYCAKGTLSHEGVEDSFLDLAAYSLLTLLLHQEQTAAPPLPAAGAGDD